MKKILSIVMIFITLVSCKEELLYNYHEQLSPTVLSISPSTGAIDSEITITGEALYNVKSVTIGGREVKIHSKISDTQLIAYASSTGISGKVEVTDSKGATSASPEDFTYDYVVPELAEADMATSGDFSADYYIAGTNMNVVDKVFFVVEEGQGFDGSSPEPVEAEILTQTIRDIVVRLPYIPADKASVSLSYFSGTDLTEMTAVSSPVEINYKTPVVTTTEFPMTDVGLGMTLEGSNLDQIEFVRVAGYDADIAAQTENSITFKVPNPEAFQDGQNPGLDLSIHYFDDKAFTLLTSDFVANVPLALFYQDVILRGQDKTVTTANFFNLETGKIVDNGDYESLDPVSFPKVNYLTTSGGSEHSFTGTSLVALNVPSPEITAEQYNSVNPYLFLTAQSSANVFFYGPTNGLTTLRNIWTADGMRVYGSKTSGCFAGTPVILFRYLDPAIPEEKELADRVMSGEVNNINDKTFPIDTLNRTIGTVNLNSSNGGTAPRGSLGHGYGNSSAGCAGWAGQIVELGQTIQPNTVVMVIYYQHYGMSSSELCLNHNPAAHIRKIGFVHIKEFTFDSSSGNPKSAGASFLKADITWQKNPNELVAIQ